MNYIFHFIILVVFYSVLLGWRANRLKAIALLPEDDYDLIRLSQLYFYLLYSNVLFLLGYRFDGAIFFAIFGLINLYLIEHYWVKNEDFRAYLSSSMIVSIVKLIVISGVTAFSLWYSGVIIEEVTWVPASTLSNTVLVLSIVMATIIYLGLLMLSLEALVLCLALVVVFETVKSGTQKFIMEMITLAIFVIPCLFTFSYLSETVFSTSFLKGKLYGSYHTNTRAHCSKIPEYAKYKPVSDTRISYIVFLSPSGKFDFNIGDCN